MRISLFIFLLSIGQTAFSQNPAITKVRNWRQQNEQTIIREFVSFLSIPDLASDSANIFRNAAFIEKMMQERKIGNIRLLSGKKKGDPPAVFGEITVPGARETIAFYAHYDGQPVNPAQWAKGLEPFTPVLFDGSLLQQGKPIPFPGPTTSTDPSPSTVPGSSTTPASSAASSSAAHPGLYNPEWRIYARGASDDKAGVTAILNAYSALTANGIKPTCNIKFLFEGEEEAGSVHLGL